MLKNRDRPRQPTVRYGFGAPEGSARDGLGALEDSRHTP